MWRGLVAGFAYGHRDTDFLTRGFICSFDEYTANGASLDVHSANRLVGHIFPPIGRLIVYQQFGDGSGGYMCHATAEALAGGIDTVTLDDQG